MNKRQVTEIALVYSQLMQNASNIRDTPLAMLWASVEEGLNDLLAGNYTEEDILPYTLYGHLQDTSVGPYFLDAWGSDIGQAGTLIYTLAYAFAWSSWKTTRLIREVEEFRNGRL